MSRARDFADLAGSANAGGITGRNLIINGAMQVAQRGDSTGVTGTAYYASDRFQSNLSSIGTWNIENVADAPAGFSNSHKLTCTAPTGTLSANDNALLAHRIEAQDLRQLDYGSSGAKAITISFYVKSNKTGNASLEINQQDTSPIRAVTLQYTINTANTWEYKEITVAGDASGVINNDNGTGFEIYWWLRSGSTFTGGSHKTAYYERVNADRNASNLDVGATANDYWQITGVQLEVGSSVTPFDHRSYGDELRRCQRYFELLGHATSAGAADTFSLMSLPFDGATNNQWIDIPFMVEKRAAPTSIVAFNGYTLPSATVIGFSTNGMTLFKASPMYFTRSSGGSQGDAVASVSAEL